MADSEGRRTCFFSKEIRAFYRLQNGGLVSVVNNHWLISPLTGVVGPLPNGLLLTNGGDPNHLQVLG